MPNMGTLQIKKNRIGKNGLSDVIGLLELPSITVLDISDNQIDDPAVVDEVLVKMPNLAVLYLKGNPVCKKIKNYKKTLIAKMPGLRYLDDSPVFPEDRRYAEAFAEGGIDKEREERKRIKQEKDEEHWRNHEAFREMIRKAKEEKARREAEAKDKQDLLDRQAESEEQPLADHQDNPEVKLEGKTQEIEETKAEEIDEVHAEEIDEVKAEEKQAVVEQNVVGNVNEEPEKNNEEEDDVPDLEEVSEEEIKKEQESLKVQNLINQYKDGKADVQDSVSDVKDDNKSEVMIDDINIDHSNSINLSVTSENEEHAKEHNAEESFETKDDKVSEEEKHLDDSLVEESAKTESVNESGAFDFKGNTSKANTRRNEDGEYLDELD
uniref:Uncharacterized protein n=1 Tax=Euplotes harpa TaxID=151035 RepID=A0A7S3J2B2_9SPIT|mmetsp:Transcript_15905/g.18425  ORF Transcript_15905/g.18425 Transcript_15905/m.18425 type:complete len:380 (+) Transcript_15905:459-1598(+)